MGLYLVIGILIGIVVTSLSFIIYISAGRKRDRAVVEERNQIIKSIAEYWADMDTLVTSYRSGLVKESGFKTTLTSKLEAVNKIFKPNMHLLDVYFVKYAERLFHEYNLVAHGNVAQFQFEEKPAFNSGSIVVETPQTQTPVSENIIAKKENGPEIPQDADSIDSPVDQKLENDISSIEMMASSSADLFEDKGNQQVKTTDEVVDEADFISGLSDDSQDLRAPDTALLHTAKDEGPDIGSFEEQFEEEQNFSAISSSAGETIIESENTAQIDEKKQEMFVAEKNEVIEENVSIPGPGVSFGEINEHGIPETTVSEDAEEFCIELDCIDKSKGSAITSEKPEIVSSEIDKTPDSDQGVSTRKAADQIQTSSFEKEFELAKNDKFEDYAMETIMDIDMSPLLRNTQQFKEETDGIFLPGKKSGKPLFKQDQQFTYLGKQDLSQKNKSKVEDELGGALHETILLKPGTNAGDPVVDSQQSSSSINGGSVQDDAVDYEEFLSAGSDTKGKDLEDNKDIEITGDDIARKIDSFFKI